jgi:hypothetical protein
MLNAELVAEYTELTSRIINEQYLYKTDVFRSEIDNCPADLMRVVDVVNETWVEPVVSWNASANEILRQERAIRKSLKAIKKAVEERRPK